MSILPRHKSSYPLDEYRPGYPQFAALLDVDAGFQNFRRFSRTRLRLLLLKQDEVVSLEKTLDDIDVQEQRKLWLGCARQDQNQHRQMTLSKLTTSLAEYDALTKDFQYAMRLPNADLRDVASIKNWATGTGCIARTEYEFLDKHEDLVNLTGSLDNAVTSVEVAIERAAFRLALYIRRRATSLPEMLKPGRSDLTQDTHIFIMGARLRWFSRVLTSWIAAGILLSPVIVLFCISSALWRLVTIALAVFLFLSALSMWTKARTIEVMTAGASYAAVLVVFTSASNALSPDYATRNLG